MQVEGKWRDVKEEMRRGRLGGEEGKVSVLKGLLEVLLEEVQQRNLIMFSRLWTSDTVSLIWINLEKTGKHRQSVWD